MDMLRDGLMILKVCMVDIEMVKEILRKVCLILR